MNAERIFRISREISRENFKICVFPGKFPGKFVLIINILEHYPGEIGNWLKSEWRGGQELIKEWHTDNVHMCFPMYYLIRSRSDCKWCNNNKISIYHLWWLLNVFRAIILYSFWCFFGAVKPPRSGPSETALRLRRFPIGGPPQALLKKI